MTDPQEDPKPTWKALFHRWFIQYNPLYLVSATLVLVGVTLLMQATASQGRVFGQLSSTVVAELYAWALIGSAALLVRRGLWRPAVMLALIIALYQCDLTLQTERSVYLGGPGVLATVLWLVSFGLKLRALAGAMKIRLSRSAFGVPLLGAAGLASIPWICRLAPSDVATPLVGILVFWILAAGLWTFRRIESRHLHASWGRTVMRRALRAVWVGWAVALVGHVLFTGEYGPAFDPTIVVSIAFVLPMRAFRTESRVWAASAATLAVVALVGPQHFAATTVMVGTVLALRAFRTPTLLSRQAQLVDDPYRFIDEPPRWPTWTLARSSPAAFERLLAGAWTCLYLAIWTAGWDGGPWPHHTLWLDAAFVGSALWWTVRRRTSCLLLSTVASAGHWVVVDRVLPTPQSTLQWSLTTIALGFAMLAVALGVSVRLRAR